MNPFPLLYSFRRCPYAIRARMALAISGIAYTTHEVSLRAKPPELIAASSKATVPVLVLPGGTVIDESLGIMRWALAQNDPEGWLQGDDPALIATFDGAFKHALDRYKYPGRYNDSNPQIHRAAGLAVLTALDHRLSQNPYLNGKDRTFTDIALFPFVRQFAAVDAAWFAAQPICAVQGWLGGLTQSDLFLGIMQASPKDEGETST